MTAERATDAWVLGDLPLVIPPNPYGKQHFYLPDRDESLCGRGTRLQGRRFIDDGETLPADGVEAANRPLSEPAPKETCSFCWKAARREADDLLTEDPSKELAGDVGYRMRWKQKGRAREEWYDIVMGPDATFEDLHLLICRFTTVFPDTHTCLYGLEAEFEDSTLGIVPAKTYEVAPRNDTRPADEVTVAEIAGEHGLDEGDRLTMAHDRGLPDHFYGIVKEVFPAEDLESRIVYPVRHVGDAAVIDEKRPDEPPNVY